MANPQISNWIAVGLGAVALACFLRLCTLGLQATYPALSWFFLLQVLTTAFSSRIGQQTQLYQWMYPGFLLVEWLVYVCVIREIYNSIFSDFPGIAILGRWSVYIALLVTGFIAAFSIVGVPHEARDSQFLLLKLETAAHCFTFGSAILLASILVAISRYPLDLHKNILFNAIFFGGVLIGEAGGLLLDELMARQNTAAVNLVVSLNTAFWFVLWLLLLSRQGQTRIFRVRQPVDSTEEARLLEQLGAINATFLRVIRR